MTGEFRFVLEPIKDLGAVESVWRPLDRAGSHCFFVSWIWIGTWLSSLPAGLAPQLLTVKRGAETVGAAILAPHRARRHRVIDARQLHFNSTGDPHLDGLTIEHNDFAGPLSRNAELWRSFVEWFAADATDAEELFLPGIEQAIANSLPATGLYRATRVSPGFRRALLPLANNGGLEASLGRNARQKLRRSIRDVQAMGELRIDEASTLECALEYFDRLKELHIRSWTRRGRPHAFHIAFFETFHRALIERGMAEGAIQLLRIRAGERAIGYLYNFKHRGRVFAYQSGFDYSDGALRPGYVCHALAIELNASQGAVEYDFLAGGNRLKETFAEDRYALSWCTLSRRTMKFRAERAARSMVRMIGRKS